MITNNGKELIAKFLLGQAPAYATHIAVGCGARPSIGNSRAVTAKAMNGYYATLTSQGHGYRIGQIIKVDINNQDYDGIFEVANVTENSFTYAIRSGATVTTTPATGTASLYLLDKQMLDFEMVRIPISSRGYVNEDGVTKIAFAAELPTTQRLLITEAGLWSAGSNANAVNTDSRQLFSFSQTEGWEHHHGTTITAIPFRATLAPANSMDVTDSIVGNVFSTTSDTPVFSSNIRASRFEPGRYLSNVIMMRGDSSRLLSDDPDGRNGTITVDSSYDNEHIHINTTALDFSQNNPYDELKLALSVVSKVESETVAPDKTRIYVEFLHNESTASSGYGRFYGEIRSSDIYHNRYFILTKDLASMDVSPDFSWSKVRIVRIFVSCYDAVGNLDTDHYVLLDAMRFDNTSSPNPLYAMTAYSPLSDGYEGSPKPLYKLANTNNYIEFRESIQVA